MSRTLLQRVQEWQRTGDRLALAVAPLGLLALRVALAIPFYRSGATKWDGFLQLKSSAVFLFTEEFRLHFFWGVVPYPAPALMAFLAGVGEIVLPVLLILGLATRLSALGILVMTIIIQLTVPAGLINFHLPWAAMALALVAYGGGTLSADRLIARFASPQPRTGASQTT